MRFLLVTLSLLLSPTANSQQILQSSLTRGLSVDTQGRLDYCTRSPIDTTFTRWDEIAVVHYSVVRGQPTDVWRVEWIPPEGSPVVYRPGGIVQGCYAWVLPLLNPPAMPGDWSVRILINGAQVLHYPFRVIAAPDSPLAYTITKLPDHFPGDPDAAPPAIHNSGQIVLPSSRRAVLTPRGDVVGMPSDLAGLPGVSPIVTGIDVREGVFLGSTLINGTRTGFRKGNEVTYFAYPNATSTEVRGSWIQRPIVVGQFIDNLGVGHGFVHTGAYNRVEPPGATSSEANGVNLAGTITGSYTDAEGVRHGFFLQGGRYTTLDVPGAKATRLWGINDGGQIAGSFVDSGGVEHGFVWHAGALRQLDVPGAVSTAAYGINGSGQVVGVYRESGKPLRPFVAFLKDRPLRFCNYEISGLEESFDAAGGSKSVRINTENGCAWSLFPDLPWLNVTTRTGVGPATTTVIAQRNAGLERQGNLLFAAKAFPVVQRGAIAALPVVTGVAHGASFTPGIPAGGWFVVTGTALANTTRTWDAPDFVAGKLPLRLDGVSVKIGSADAYPYFVSPTQLNVLAPFAVPEGAAAIEVTGPNGVARFNATVRRHEPGIFLIGPIKDGRAPAAAVHADGTLVGESGLIPGAITRPAAAGDSVSLYGTGFGPAAPAIADGSVVTSPVPLASPVEVFVGGKAAVVEYVGIVGVGLVQLNVRVPEGLAPGSHFVLAVAGGRSSTAVATIFVK